MQCSNCQFQNIPGVQTCGRCGASLQLASLAIDVHPPRASRAAKRGGGGSRSRRYWNRFRSRWRRSPAIRISGWPADLQTPGVLLRMIVPGWAQRYTGRVRRARWMFWGYLGLLLSGLLFVGTGLGWLLLGLAISLHAASVLDIVAADVVDFRQRLIYSGVAMLVLVAVVYYPAGRLLALVATPQQFNLAAPPFAGGGRCAGESFRLPMVRSAAGRRGSLPSALTRRADDRGFGQGIGFIVSRATESIASLPKPARK